MFTEKEEQIFTEKERRRIKQIIERNNIEKHPYICIGAIIFMIIMSLSCLLRGFIFKNEHYFDLGFAIGIIAGFLIFLFCHNKVVYSIIKKII
jgi:hypothetical protein